jgi:DNA polymerase-3 subunit delta'
VNAPDVYPWLAGPWGRLRTYLESGRIPQALLIVGLDGIGKGLLAEGFARRLLCRETSEAACGHCQSCVLLEAGTHPDYVRVGPAEPGKAITVDSIRGLIATLSLKPQYSGRRVVILAPAEQMNTAAANSLLKTLEEPDAHTTLLLLTEAPERLPATIRSRCQRLNLPVPPRRQAVAWLQCNGCGDEAEVLLSLAKGAPLRALSYAANDIIAQRAEFFRTWLAVAEGKADPVVAAEQWQKTTCEQLVGWMGTWTIDLIRLCAAPACSTIDNPDLRHGLQATAAGLNLPALFRYLDLLNASRRGLGGQVNRQMVLEELLIGWWETAPNAKRAKVDP